MTDLSVSDLDAIHATWGADALEQVLSTGLSWAELGAVPRPERVDRFGPGASADLPAAAAPLPYTEATQHLVPSDGVPPWVGRSALRPPLLWAAGTFPDRPTVGFGGTNFPTDTGAVISAEGAVAVARQGVPVAAILGTELGHVVVSSALAVGGTVVAVLQTGIGAPAVSDRTIDQVVDAGGAVVSAEPFAGLMSSGSLERAERLMLSLSCALVAPEAGA